MPPNLPTWLQRTPAEQAEEAKVQVERRAGFTRARLTEAERLVSRGTLLEETARQNLTAAETDMNVEQIMQSRTQLAEALVMQGRYKEASHLHPDTGAQDRYREIQTAIELDDSEKCGCEDIQGEEISITPRFEERRIFSSKHGEVVSLVRCSKCNHLNARPVVGRLLLARGVREQNRRAAQTDGRGATRDIDLLRNAGT